NEGEPLLIDQYVTGIEVDVDAISDGETTIVPGIMEHIERSGVHSGDSIAVYPPQRLSDDVKRELFDTTDKIAKELNDVGLINIQFNIKGIDMYVSEVKSRSSRIITFLSKITSRTMANLATKTIMGELLRESGFKSGIITEHDDVFVKIPVFSFE